jgi:hypothetical protein
MLFVNIAEGLVQGHRTVQVEEVFGNRDIQLILLVERVQQIAIQERHHQRPFSKVVALLLLDRKVISPSLYPHVFSEEVVHRPGKVQRARERSRSFWLIEFIQG